MSHYKYSFPKWGYQSNDGFKLADPVSAVKDLPIN